MTKTIENADEWAGKAEMLWQQRTTEGRKAKEEMDRKEEHRIKLLGFQGGG